LCAVKEIGKTPDAVGFPLSRPAEVSVTPGGKVPVSLKVGAGDPAAVTLNDPGVFKMKAVLAALVKDGGIFTVTVAVD
jgi:hypothetical protein